jgi:ABC-2 type transport system ATP-binding protein
MDAIRTENLTKTYRLGWRTPPVVALDRLNLRVRTGEIYGLLGPNGSGKSTTLKLLLHLITPTAGAAWLFDVPGTQVAARAQVGYLPESPDFHRHLTGAETLAFYGKLCGLRGAALHQRIDELLELVALTPARDRRLATYSKGMLQRLGLAQALVHDPPLLLLDEPTAGVDPVGSREICDLIRRLKQLGKTILLSSHLLTQIQNVCDRVGVLHCGKLILEDEVAPLIRNRQRLIFTVQDLPAAGRDQIAAAVQAAGGKLVSVGHPETTLESLFIDTLTHDGTNTA